MTAGAVLCLVWPLAARRTARSGTVADVGFYTDLVREVDDDIARGLIPPAEAATARAEIGRRLLAAARAAPEIQSTAGWRARRLAAVAMVVLLVPALAVGLYLYVGHPARPDMPLAARNQGPDDLMAAIAKIEAHLASHPEDGHGFELVAPIYLRMGRTEDAARAFRAAIAASGDTAARENALGNALVAGADGVVTDEARAAFEKALGFEPTSPQARFFVALAAEQDGDKPKAATLWQALLEDTPADAPWRASVAQHLAAVTGQPAPAPSGAPTGVAADAIAALPAGAQREAIQGMVDGLAARLAQNGRDAEGWLRLIKAYTVLGESDRAKAALRAARLGLAGDSAALDRLDAAARELGLDG